MRGDRGVQLPLRLPYRVAAHTKAHANAKGGGVWAGALLLYWCQCCCSHGDPSAVAPTPAKLLHPLPVCVTFSPTPPPAAAAAVLTCCSC